jgi:hypothetical protein
MHMYVLYILYIYIYLSVSCKMHLCIDMYSYKYSTCTHVGFPKKTDMLLSTIQAMCYYSLFGGSKKKRYLPRLSNLCQDVLLNQ